MAADPKRIELELDNLERSIALLKRDYEIFFAGGSKQPPNDQRDKLDKAIKRMATLQGLSYALRFRYNSIVARFNTYLDLWNKQLRVKEEGRSPMHVGGVSREMRQQWAEQTPKIQTAEKAKQTAEKPPEPFTRIYGEYLRTRKELGEGSPNVTFEGFVKIVSKQRDQILQKFHCQDVEFYVAVEKGHTKLKARPVK